MSTGGAEAGGLDLAQLERFVDALVAHPRTETLDRIEVELIAAGAGWRELALTAVELSHRSRNLVLGVGGRGRLAAYVHAYRLFDRYDWVDAARAAEQGLNHWPQDPFLVCLRAAGDTAAGIPTGPRGLAMVLRREELSWEVGMIAARGYWNAPPSREGAEALLELTERLTLQAQRFPQTPQTEVMLHCFQSYALRVLGRYDEALSACSQGFTILGRLANQQQQLDAEGRQRLGEELSTLYGTLSRERDTIRQGQWMETTYGPSAQQLRDQELAGDDPFGDEARQERLELSLSRAPGSRLAALAAAEIRAASVPHAVVEEEEEEWEEEPALLTGTTSAVAAALVLWTLLALILPGSRSNLAWILGTAGAALVGAGAWSAWNWVGELRAGRSTPAYGLAMLVVGAVSAAGVLLGAAGRIVPLLVAGLGMVAGGQLLATTYARHRVRRLQSWRSEGGAGAAGRYGQG